MERLGDAVARVLGRLEARLREEKAEGVEALRKEARMREEAPALARGKGTHHQPRQIRASATSAGTKPANV